ncbi:MAG: molybdopterin molybdenumtransferase MoeA [Chloroflexi bacterium CG_4_9_14_3_um_filter_45_9]|nr:MAG: molybdopterin molybdenumtransferase MoeA [Chloroflexi bacterium CG08_land_8_20_14_0_20_45_12]PIX27126.1 MAG: molybdopterin molybdenumtransferase MoeA [Chloroflexi bacterium CG_4_8_14_3_um_filter_45_15]PJB47287.1 MAG: molybdopterin molybdenumtransferase MoeA [Chloroflexi bacterium CG_4_9_14_3_um_filter_45_9]
MSGSCSMISVEEALEKILSFVEVLDPEEKPILGCLGQVLVEDVYADIDIPPWDNSAMDGYAIKAEDTYGANKLSPRFIPVVGEIAAGSIADKELKPGTAIRIMTGAPLPQGADAVVQFEDTDELTRQSLHPLSQIGILREAKKGLNVRRRGEDIAKGTLVLRKGTILRPAEIGVLASLGHSTASVIRRPIVSVLATGDELIEPGQPKLNGKIYNSNTYTIAAEVLRYGGIPEILGIGRDSVESLNRKIDESLTSDMLITCGGVSLGDYDIVKDVLAKRGQIALWTICMKPGKPSAFGVIRQGRKRLPHLGLPGNPVSAMITFEQFARPAILKMMGKENLAKPTVQAIMDDAVENTDGRRIFARVVLNLIQDTKVGEEYHACLVGPQGSGILTSMAKANGLAIIPENIPGVKPGDKVLVQMLDW